MAEPETTPTAVHPAVSAAAGLTADDLIDQVIEDLDEEETPEPEETAPVAVDSADDPAPAEDPAEDPAEVAAVDPVPEPAEPAPEKPPVEAVADELADVEKLIEELDPFDADQVKAVMKNLVDKVRGQQDVIREARVVNAKAAEDQYWQDFSAKNPELKDTGRKLWDAAIARHKEKGLTGDRLNLAASTEWELKIEQAKAAAKKPPAKPAPSLPTKVTPNATRISPTQRTKPPSVPRGYEEKLMSNAYGQLDSIVD